MQLEYLRSQQQQFSRQSFGQQQQQQQQQHNQSQELPQFSTANMNNNHMNYAAANEYSPGAAAHEHTHSHIEEESNDSSNQHNNYSGDQYEAEQHRRYLNSYAQNYKNHLNQATAGVLSPSNQSKGITSYPNQQMLMPNPYHHLIAGKDNNDDEDDNDQAAADDNDDFARRAQMAQFHSLSRIQEHRRRDGRGRQLEEDDDDDEEEDEDEQRDNIRNDNDDSLASEIKEHLEVEGFEDLFTTIAKDFKENRISEALDVCEHTIYNAQRVKGPASFLKLFTQILKFLNNEAVNSLNTDHFEKALFILIKCKHLTELQLFGVQPPSLRALTFNNFGVYYRKLNQLPKALGYLEQALRFLNSIKSREYIGTTYLNIAAVLSQMGEHYAALENAKKAVVEIHKDYQNYLNRKTYEEAFKEPEFIDLSQSLAIAFYNVGVEQEHFQNFEVSLINYGKACEVAEDNLGASHKLTTKFKNLFHQFNLKLQQSEKSKKNGRIIMSAQQQKGRRVVSASQKSLQNYKVQQPQQSISQAQSLQQFEDKIMPFQQSYGIRPNDFTQVGRNVVFKPKQIQPQTPVIGSRPSTGSRMGSTTRGSTPLVIVTRPPSAFVSKPLAQRNSSHIRPVSAKMAGTSSISMTGSGMTASQQMRQMQTLQQPMRFSATIGGRPQSAQVSQLTSAAATASGGAQFGQNGRLKQAKPILIRPGKATKNQQQQHQQQQYQQMRQSNNQKEALDWEEYSPMNLSNFDEEQDEEVYRNQRQFLRDFQQEAAQHIEQLRAEENELRDRITQLKQQELKAKEIADEEIRKQKAQSEEEEREQAAKRKYEEEFERQVLAELREAKKREINEIQRLQALKAKVQHSSSHNNNSARDDLQMEELLDHLNNDDDNNLDNASHNLGQDYYRSKNSKREGEEFDDQVARNPNRQSLSSSVVKQEDFRPPPAPPMSSSDFNQTFIVGQENNNTNNDRSSQASKIQLLQRFFRKVQSIQRTRYQFTIQYSRNRIYCRVFTYQNYRLLLLIYQTTTQQFLIDIASLNNKQTNLNATSSAESTQPLPRIYDTKVASNQLVTRLLSTPSLNPFESEFVTLEPTKHSFTIVGTQQESAEMKAAASRIQQFHRSNFLRKQRKAQKHTLIQQFIINDQLDTISNSTQYVFCMFFNPAKPKLQPIVTFENLLPKPNRFFLKVSVPKIISQTLLIEYHQGRLNPFQYFFFAGQDTKQNEQMILPKRLYFTDESKALVGQVIQSHYRTTFISIYTRLIKLTPLVSQLNLVEISLLKKDKQPTTVRAVINTLAKGEEGDKSDRMAFLNITDQLLQRELLRQIKCKSFFFKAWFQFDEQNGVITLVYDPNKVEMREPPTILLNPAQRHKSPSIPPIVIISHVEDEEKQEQFSQRVKTEQSSKHLSAREIKAIDSKSPDRQEVLIQYQQQDQKQQPLLKDDVTVVKTFVSWNIAQAFEITLRVFEEDGERMLSISATTVDEGGDQSSQNDTPPDVSLNYKEQMIPQNVSLDQFIRERLLLSLNYSWQIVTEAQYRAVMAIQNFWNADVLVKRQQFVMRFNAKKGQVDVIEGECQLRRTRRKGYYVKLVRKSTSSRQLNDEETVQLGYLDQEQTKRFKANFSLLVNTNIVYSEGALRFIDRHILTDSSALKVKSVQFQ